MGMAVIVDGQVVYGDAAELKNMQLAEVSRELERLSGDIHRLLVALNVAKESLTAMLKEMTPVVRTPVAPDEEAHTPRRRGNA
jgi:predicted house-cleaning NTP pyrophosphatase (Maf/HAM1 superfamily)